MAKVSTLQQSAAARIDDYCKDLAEWPRSWMGLPEDLVPGEKMVAYFRPFLEHLIDLGLSRKTIRKHVDNLWVLGGEMIRDLHQTPSLQSRLSPRCICYPDKEPPFFCDPDEEEAAARVECPLHGERFKRQQFFIYVASWMRAKEPARRQRLSSQYRKAWDATFPQSGEPSVPKPGAKQWRNLGGSDVITKEA